jgi:hypothetical protein
MMTMRYATLMVSLWGCAVLPVQLVAQVAEAASPDTVVFAAPRGNVVFTHNKHATMADCVSCHHESRPEKPLESPYQKCIACHTTPPTEPVTTSRRNAFHDVVKKEGMCYDCHKAEAAKGTVLPSLLLCADCHKQ